MMWTAASEALSLYLYWHPVTVRGRRFADLAEAAGRNGRQLGKPVLMMGINEGIGSFVHVPVVRAEQRAQTWLMLVHGARGVTYFTATIMHRDTIGVFEQLATDVKTLAPALTTREPVQTVTYEGVPAEQHAVDLSLRRMPDGQAILLAVNKEDYPIEWRCGLPWASPGAVIQPIAGTDVAPAWSDQTISETLEPLATRAYRLEGTILDDDLTEYPIRSHETHPPPHAAMLRGNLVVNPGFEQQANAWRYHSPKGAKLMIADDQAHGGETCLRLVHSRWRTRTRWWSPIRCVYGRMRSTS